MKTYVRTPNDRALLSRKNQHDRLAGTLGILPNHLIKLIRSHDSENLKKIVNDLRITTFWSTYNIWAKHQTLIRTYWKIIPQCCIPDIKEKKTDSQRKKRKRRTKKLVREDCKNPFHYLILKKNTHPVQGTCNCNVQICRLTNVDTRTILHFHDLLPPATLSRPTFHTTNIDSMDTSGLDHKHTPTIRGTQLALTHSLAKTSGNISREQQDRSFKQTLLFDFLR